LKAAAPALDAAYPEDGTMAATPRDKIRAHCAEMRRLGMKPVVIWVPDPDSPHFEAEARRQSRLAAEAPDEQEIMDFIEQVSAWDDEDPRAKG
jgi:hypothetical protein